RRNRKRPPERIEAEEQKSLPVLTTNRRNTVMRKRIAVLLGVIVTVAAVVSAVALGKPSMSPMSFKASLDSRQETPRPKGVPVRAGGSFQATLSGKPLKWTLSFDNLSGAAVAAHVHAGKKNVSGPVIV